MPPPPVIHFPAPSVIRLSLHAKPGARQTRFCDALPSTTPLTHLAVQLAARPVDGEANDELCRFVGGVFGVRRRGDVRVVRGERSREKTVQVEGLEEGRWDEARIMDAIRANM